MKKKHQLELLGVKNKITGSKNHLTDLIADLYTAEEWISGLEDKSEELSRRQQGETLPVSSLIKENVEERLKYMESRLRSEKVKTFSAYDQSSRSSEREQVEAIYLKK